LGRRADTERRGKVPARGKNPTVADVAELAGVSPMTVSRVVNQHPKVREETRSRVEAAIAKLGYVPNIAARSLAGVAQCRIALLHSNPSSAYLSEFLIGSLEAARTSDALLQVEVHDEGETIASVVDRLVLHRTDAVLLPPPLSDDWSLIEALDKAGLLVAQIATGHPSPLAQSVVIDDEAAAHAMTLHLLSLGHRRIGFIIGNINQTASSLRRNGYIRALEEFGQKPDPTLIVQGDFTYRSGLAGADTLLSHDARPTAIFASNDDMAAAAIAIAHRRNLDVPSDVTVVGFDDTSIATTIWPELTTIRQPVAKMSGRATELLAAAARKWTLEGARKIHHQRLHFELVRRCSDAPPAKRH
jgi:LacI family transcriptional regulator